jgi:hypothetical protein
MTQTKTLVVLAGLALSTAAFAQSDNSRAYSAELVSDAGARVSLLDGGSGYDKQGFMIGSADGNNSMYVGGSAQIRYYADFRNSNGGANERYTGGFENNLTRLGVKGSVWNKDFTYNVRGEFNNTGSFSLENAFASYNYGNGFGITAGQFKNPFLRESMIDNEYQLAAERSVTEGVFSAGYSQGIQFTYASDAFRLWAGFTDGTNTANTAFTSTSESDYALNARFEFKAMGAGWERFNDFTSWKSAEDTGLLIGAGVNYQDGGSTGAGTTGTTASNEQLGYTIDAQLEGQGWNAFASFTGGHTDDGTTKLNNFGFVAQGGIFVTDQVELFGRWDSIFWDNDLVDGNGDSLKNSHFLTGGINYYLSQESQAAKVTIDAIYAFETSIDGSGAGDGHESVLPTGNYGLLGEPKDGELALRAQLQVVF